MFLLQQKSDSDSASLARASSLKGTLKVVLHSASASDSGAQINGVRGPVVARGFANFFFFPVAAGRWSRFVRADLVA